MYKAVIAVVAISMTLSACSTTEQGAYNGLYFGSVVGGAIGGLTDGRRGHFVGTMVGTLVGGAAGAAIGAKNESDLYKRYNQAQTYQPEQRQPSQRQNRSHRSNRGNMGNYGGYSSPLVLRDLRFIDSDGNQVINRGERCQIVFELANPSGRTVTDIIPVISEINGNNHLHISPSTRIEAIRTGDAIRYTAAVVADKRIKRGQADFRIAVSVEGGELCPLCDFSIGLSK